MTVILFLLGAVALLVLVSGVYVFFAACVRRKDLPWLVEAQIKKTPYGLYYDGMRAADQWLREHKAEDVFVMSDDALRLHGLWIPAKDPVGTVLLTHGYRSTMLLDFCCAFEYYHDRNMNILVPDQRCHGKSEGVYITFGVKESNDMVCWLEYIRQRVSDQPVFLHGLSMGATTVLYLADRALPCDVRGIIADCGFTSAWDILSSVYRNVTHLPPWISLWITDLAARLFAGFSLKEKDTRKSLAASRLPVLLIHGEDDTFVPCDMTKQAYAACSGEKNLLLVEGADHGVSFLKDQRAYVAKLSEFINSHM
ncbi:MAG: alpha/beta hydrolase [Oscillospiraceae bacterium]|nr:alpha/beta hydrolase [Oscillospiraceae bacterium]